jgi:hypothetical protein
MSIVRQSFEFFTQPEPIWYWAAQFRSAEQLPVRGKIMRAVLGLAGLLIVLLIGWLVYTSQIRQMPDGKPLARQADFVAVRGDLLSLGQAERLYYAINGRYADLGELRRSNATTSFPDGGRSGYQYAVKVEGDTHFRITAVPIDSSRTDLRPLSIDETMQISQ